MLEEEAVSRGIFRILRHFYRLDKKEMIHEERNPSSELQRMKELEVENAKLKRMFAQVTG